MAKRNSSATRPKRLAFRLTVFFVITAVLGVSLLWRFQLNALFGLTRVEEGAYGGTAASTVRTDGGDLMIHFIDVGQGDACVLELPDGKIALIDAGPKKSQDQLLSYLDANFPSLQETKKLDIAVLTHSDEDHTGGFPAVLDNYSVGDFYRPNEKATRAGFEDPDAERIVGTGKKDTVIYRDTILKAHQKADNVIVVNAGVLDAAAQDVIKPEGKTSGDAGYYEIVFFGPYAHSYTDHNNYSPILIVEYEGKRIALSGDAEKQAEAEFVQNARDKTIKKFERFTDSYSVDVIKLGHHGSRTSSSADYLNVLTTPASAPSVLTVVSVGFNNSYGHPHEQVLSRLGGLGFSSDNLLRTDAHGNIVLAVRFDETANAFLLFHGATAQNRTESAPVTWPVIALFLWITSAIILLLPLMPKTRSSSAKTGGAKRKTSPYAKPSQTKRANKAPVKKPPKRK